MTPDEPTWDDTGFDAGANDNSGFLSSESGSRKRVTPEEPPAAPPPPPRREQSRRGPLFWFLVLAGVVFVVAVVGGFFYWVTQPSVEEQAFMAPASETSAPTAAAEPSAPVDATHSTATDVDVVHDPEALELLYGSDSAAAQRGTIAEKSTEKKEPTSSTPAETEKPTSAPTTSPTPSIAKKSTPPPTPVAKPTPIAKPTPTPAPTKKAETTSAPKGTSALYVVQVFSSPSRADAEEWLQLLRTKNVSDGYVTEQHIKGELWYRVRFGSFTTRESAESAAIRMGFKEPWIARIR